MDNNCTSPPKHTSRFLLDFRESSLNDAAVDDDNKSDDTSDEECSSVETFQSMSDDCLVNMKLCRDMNILCDAQFEVDGQIVRAHKIILASRSQYFRAMFTSQMKESYECVIKLNNVSFDIFSSIIDFLYTGRIEVSNNNIESLFHLSHLYDIKQLEIICISYIYDHLCLYNCKNIYLLCVIYMCCTYDLIQKIHVFISNNFDLIVSSNEINNWSYDDLRFIFYNLDTCLACVKLPTEFHQRRFLEWVESHYSELSPCDKNSAYLQQLSPSSNNNTIEKPLKYIHHFHKVMFVVGGICDEDLINSPECLPLDFATHQKATPTSSLVAPISAGGDTNILPTLPLKKGIAFAGVTSDMRNVFILGGLISRKQSIKLSDKVYKYSALDNSWSLHSTLPCGGVEGIAAVYRNERTYEDDVPRIYAAGGRSLRPISASDGAAHRTQFVYHNNLWVFMGNEWVSLPSMKTKRAFHGLVFYCNEMYAIGGQGEDGEPLSSVEIYNPERKEWRQSTSNLRIPRSHICCVVSKEHIYAITGNMAELSQEYKHHTLNQYAPQERYNIRLNAWELLSEKSLPHLLCVGALSDETRIVLCGGKTSLRDNATVLKRRLDSSCGECFWHPLAPLVRKRWGHMVALLQVPEYLALSPIV
uniref:Kelch-like protein diablo n=2 Tax=Cacopsylla melanoneura TaxID=428564 RepID=A0A8D9BB85_9HEMI